MDKDHEKDNGKHADNADDADYTNCLYYKGNEFGPWTTPGSSFYSDNSNNRGSYSKASLKFSGIYINNFNPGRTNCTMNVRFLTQDMIKKNANFRKKAALKITGQSVSTADKTGWRTFMLRFNQEVSVIPGKNIDVYDAVSDHLSSMVLISTGTRVFSASLRFFSSTPAILKAALRIFEIPEATSCSKEESTSNPAVFFL